MSPKSGEREPEDLSGASLRSWISVDELDE
jgi:hypothetical protein